METMATMRDELVTASRVDFTDDLDGDYWQSQRIVLDFFRRAQLSPSHMRTRFGEFYRLEAMEVMKISPYSSKGAKVQATPKWEYCNDNAISN